MDITATEPRHVHVYLGDLGTGEVHVHIHAATTADGGTGKPATEPTVAASLKRLKDWDNANAENLQATFDGLEALGCVPHPAASRNPRPGGYIQPYLRWTHPRHPGGSVGYLNAASFSVTGKNEMPRVASLPGADARSEVRFPVTSPEGVQQALAAVRHLIGNG